MKNNDGIVWFGGIMLGCLILYGIYNLVAPTSKPPTKQQPSIDTIFTTSTPQTPLETTNDERNETIDQLNVPSSSNNDERNYDTAPSFPGGLDSLSAFLYESIQYPPQALKTKINGVVHIAFIVDINGNVTKARVLKGIGGGCNEEALRVINSLPQWKPGTLQGKPTPVEMTLPIRFSL
jgi:protein TonB